MTMIINRWDEDAANSYLSEAGDNPADRDLALRVYTSRLIGQNPDLVMHGGGNTSVKTERADLFGTMREVLHVKGSGWDLDTIEGPGLPGVWMQPLRELRALPALIDEDMVNVQRCNLLDSTSPNPSVETLLHAFLPHKFVDHTHATPFLVLANLPNAKEICAEIFGDRLAVVNYIMPGFQLARVAAQIYEANPDVEGLLLLNHGHFAFGDTAKQSYDLIVEHTNMVAAYFGMESPTKIGERMPASDTDVLVALRGAIGDAMAEIKGDIDAPMPILDLRNGPDVLAFFTRGDVGDLAKRGVASPDHVIRTKAEPLWLPRHIWQQGKSAIAAAIADYAATYKAYFERQSARLDVPKTMLSPLPNLAWIEGFGIVGIASSAGAASVAADLGEQNLRVRCVGEDHGGFHPIGEADLFDMEYWSLEQAKLGKAKALPFAGRVVMVTGAGGAIGAELAKAFAAEGASMVLVDRAEDALANVRTSLGGNHHAMTLDITDGASADQAMQAATLRFGGLDIIISNAGAAAMGTMADVLEEDLRQSFELNFYAQNRFANAAAALFAKQGRGGQILFNLSKITVNPGRNFGPYGLPKAASMYLLRQLALELGEAGVRVNGVNADRIRSGLVNEDFIKSRAASRGVSEDVYMAGNLMKREVEVRHVAQAFVALAKAERTSAHVMTVDGGNIEASLR